MIEELGGKADTGEIIEKIGGHRDKKIYAAIEGYVTTGFLTKTKIPPKLTKNLYTLTSKGTDVIKSYLDAGKTFDVEVYRKDIISYRQAVLDIKAKTGKKGRIMSSDLKKAKAKPAPKKDPGPTINPIYNNPQDRSDAATAAVEGIAWMVKENKDLHQKQARLRQAYLILHEIFGGENEPA